MSFEPWMVLPIYVAILLGLRWLERTDTRIGRGLKASTEEAAQMAIEQREREIEEIRSSIR